MRAYGFGVKRRDYGRTCRCCPPKYGKGPSGRGAKKRARQEAREQCAETTPALYPDDLCRCADCVGAGPIIREC